MKEELVYYERQNFNQWWVFLVIIIVDALFIYGCIIQLGFGKSWGNNPMDNTMLIIVTALLILLTISFFFFHLDTIINKEGVYERLFPYQFRFRFTPWDYISDTSVKKISPIREFGGWGIRFKITRIGGSGIHYGIGKKAYIISGNYALELTLNNSTKILIGTQKPDELAEFLDKLNAKRKQK